MKNENESISAFGATRSGPTLISQLGLTGFIDYIIDDHPQKVEKYSSGDGLKSLSTIELLMRLTDYIVILAWVHSLKIIQQNNDYLEKGGKFILICPELRIIKRS